MNQDPMLSKRIDESLRACLKEGVAAQVMIEIVEYYMTPFALFLHASTRQIGLMVALPFLLGSIAQFFTVRVVRLAGSRMRLLLRGIALQIVLLLPIGLLSLPSVPHRVEILIAAAVLYKLLGTLTGPSWGSMVSEYLPEQRRGNYFGWRSKWVGISGVTSMTLCGVFLSLMKRFSGEAAGFVVLFGIAGLARMTSFYFMSRMVELPAHETAQSHFTFWMFLRRFRESNFVKFIFYVSSITFATQLASPYFSVYMLRDLHFNYVAYTAVQLASIVSGLFAFPVWGRHADKVGNARILKLTSFIIPVFPILWTFWKSPIYLICVETFSGIIWGGFNLCSANFIYDAVSPDKRVRCLSYFNLINGTAAFAGASLGGVLADKLPKFNGSPLLTLFVMSGALRFLADFILSRHFREVREETEHMSSVQLFFSVLGVQPMIGRVTDWSALPSEEQRRLGRIRSHPRVTDPADPDPEAQAAFERK